MSDYNQAYAWAYWLTASPETAVFNWRFIHDKDKARPAIKRRGTLPQMWQTAGHWNSQGYGVFAVVSEMDGDGYTAQGEPIREFVGGDTLEHVASVRAHYVDLDNLNAMSNLSRAADHWPAPWFAVATSPGKAHVYWPLFNSERYRDNETFRVTQRKLRQFFDGDKAVIDATRVLRVPGFWHCKGEPHLVTCYQLPGFGSPIARDMLIYSLAHINAPDDGGGRHRLGDPDLAGPSIDWIWYALESMPVDGMSHPDFVSFTAAYKQAGWSMANPDELRDRWLIWCDRFGTESKGRDYNLKHWKSITDTEVGWKSLLRRNPNLNAQWLFRGGRTAPPLPAAVPNASEVAGPLLLAEDCARYFAGCVFVTQMGRMLTPKAQLLEAGAFNGTYGGPRFAIAASGAPTDEPWKAATRSIFWRVPVVDYLRFLPHREPGAILTDELDRTGVNTYKPARIVRQEGDASPFLNHLALILPDARDQRIILDYIAHNAKYPGYKIPWAPVIQSTEGAGKGIFKTLMSHLIGSTYFYVPDARQLNESGSTFNGWMRQKLFILADEIKTDERRDMIEVLKPWITEKEIEVQGKGQDQQKEDNYANWMFFTNYKDAVPINENSRRFAMFFSALQSKKDILAAGLGEDYFIRLNRWLELENGCAIMAHWFLNYPIEKGVIPYRAPETSSYDDAIRQGRTPIERALLDAIESNSPGFRGGWVSTIKATEQVRALNLRGVSQTTIERIIESLGYHMIGRAPRVYFSEDGGNVAPILFHKDRNARPEDFGPAQGYGFN